MAEAGARVVDFPRLIRLIGLIALTGLTALTLPAALSAQVNAVNAPDAANASDTLDALSPADMEARDRAVLMARAGDYGPALETLDRLHRASPLHVPLKADLVTVLSWSGQDQAALELGEDLPFATLAHIVSEAVARSARNVGRPAYGAELYANVLTRDPSRVESWVGHILSILEWGDAAWAESEYRTARARFPDHPDILLAGAHVLRATGRPFEAALLLRQATERGADSDEAFRLEVLSLLEGGAVFLAVERMAEAPERLDAGERGRVLAARGSRAVQWSRAPTLRHADRFEATDRALELIDSALVVVDPADGFPWGQLRFDRILALHDRARMEDVVAQVLELEAAGVELPPFVLLRAGDAYLQLRQPEQAEMRYRAALEGWGGYPAEAAIGLFHALVQLERQDEAREVVRRLLEQEPPARTAEGLREPLPNPDRLSAVIADNMGRAFANDLPGAQAGFEEYSARAPMNLDLRQERAAVHLWRGWPRSARDQYLRILALEPDHVGAGIGHASTELALDERGSARASLTTVLALAPENPQVRDAQESYRVDGLWELAAGGHAGRSSGGELGTRDDAITTRLTTPPLGDRVRLFAGLNRSYARYPDTNGLHERLEAGTDFRSRAVQLELRATADREELDRVGAGGRLELRPGDHWTLRLEGESRSNAVPLQAARLGTDGWRAEAGIGYRWSERRFWNLSATQLEMSDGNRRQSAYTGLEQELLRGPRNRFVGILEGYGATNSLEGAPYFNPSSFGSASVTGRWEMVLWRSYHRSITQRLSATGGRLFQEEFDDAFIYSAALAQEWVVSTRFRFDVGVEWGRPVYDNDRERRTAFHARLNWRLPR